jgi:TolB-like protein/DNA-binding SARP family transcriptional activator/Tfp pilus assembly protein PilF
MASLQLRLLGGFEARTGGREADIPGRKERALLAFLAIPPGERRSRDKLAGLLWSDRADSQARDSLKQAVFKLRKALDSVRPSPIRVDREFVSLDSAAIAVDVAEFEQLLGTGTPEAVARATALYRGDLLDGLDGRDPAFDDWLLMERQRLRTMARDGLARLLDLHLASGAHDQAAVVARRLLGLDPLREVAHRALMQIYAEQGQTALALRQYQLCRDTLQGEIGATPEAETERLYRSIQGKRTAARRALDYAPAEHGAAETSSQLDASSSHGNAEAAPTTVRPTIAVLPFTNLSGDPGQQYFSDGVTEDIATELSRFHSLSVIAHNAASRYRDQDVDVRRVARELGVQFIVEGSVRKIGKQIRITAQLIDAATGKHVWAERFDRDEQDIFLIQDEVISTIAGTLVGRLQAAGAEHARRKPPASLAAYECLLRGNALPFGDPEADAEARRLFERAIALDPNYARAHSLLAMAEYRLWRLDPAGSGDALERAVAAAKKAAALDENDSICHNALGWFHLLLRTFDLAEHHYRKGYGLNPNSATNVAGMGILHNYLGCPDEAMVWLEKAKQVDRFFDPAWYWQTRGIVHFVAHRYDKAIADFAHGPFVTLLARAYVAACYAHTDRIDRAREVAAEILAARPGFSVAQHLRIEPYKRQVDIDHLAAGLRKAGLPD